MVLAILWYRSGAASGVPIPAIDLRAAHGEAAGRGGTIGRTGSPARSGDGRLRFVAAAEHA
jgi:hypothetical protein